MNSYSTESKVQSVNKRKSLSYCGRSKKKDESEKRRARNHSPEPRGICTAAAGQLDHDGRPYHGKLPVVGSLWPPRVHEVS
jgi:hypothetical protein